MKYPFITFNILLLRLAIAYSPPTFNVPIAEADHAGRAVDCAEPILRGVVISEFAGELLEVRIGVNTGLLITGNLGGGGQQKYTVHGDAMNMAPRLEALNKETKTTLPIADSTAGHLDRTDLQDVGSITLRGLTSEVPVYMLAGTRNLSATDID